MGKQTSIEWTNTQNADGTVTSGATWNPWQGCHKVSPGCKHCYMYRDKERYGQDPQTVVRSAPATFNSPLKWHEPARVFTCSWSDWFIEEADPWRPAAWEIIRQTPHLTYQILTKRPENIASRLPLDWKDGYPNVWLGVSVESQEYADKRIPLLLDTPAQVRFLSCEPLLGPLDLENIPDREYSLDVLAGKYGSKAHKLLFSFGMAGRGKIDWVITGGESGPKAKVRPADPDWFRSIRDQCNRAGVAFFHKQNGGSKKDATGTWGGRDLDGRMWDEFPTSAELAEVQG